MSQTTTTSGSPGSSQSGPFPIGLNSRSARCRRARTGSSSQRQSTWAGFGAAPGVVTIRQFGSARS
jgi:hypothetical protein